MFQEPAMYRDREAAGRALARRLIDSPYAKEDPVVVCIPRGSVPIAQVVAQELDCDLDVCMVRRILCPAKPDQTIAAITENGDIHLTDRSSWGMSRKYIEEVRMTELADIRQRRLLYNTPEIPLKRRTVILVDDGISTGSSILAAIHVLKKQNPAKIVVATPVASKEAIEKISKKKIAELIVLYIPPTFMVIAQHYLDFTPVTDLQVIDCLRANRMRLVENSQRLPRPSISSLTSATSSESSSDSSDVEEKDEVLKVIEDGVPPRKLLPKHIIFRARKRPHSSCRTLQILEEIARMTPAITATDMPTKFEVDEEEAECVSIERVKVVA